MIKYSENLCITVYVFLFWQLILILIFLLLNFFQKKIFKNKIERDLEIKFQKEYLHEIFMMQEQERERIAKDLHDEIGSKLNLVSLYLYSLKSLKKTESQKRNIIDSIIQINDNAIENSRRIAHNLLPPVLEKFGLNQAIIELILDFEKTKMVSINYQNRIEFSSSGFNIQVQLFRIIQELINNSLKHGNASEIKIDFGMQNNKRQCIYKDNGLGFDVSQLYKTRGFGMQNIESRIELLNGTLGVDSEKGKGIVVVFNFDF
jgi:signal transduction histidine kinase